MLVNQSLSTTTTVDGLAGTSTITTATTSSPGTTAPLRPEPGAGGQDEDDPPAVSPEEREDAARTGAEERGQQPEAKSEVRGLGRGDWGLGLGVRFCVGVVMLRNQNPGLEVAR